MISELRRTYPLALLLNIAQMSRSIYYYHLKRHKDDKYKEIKIKIQEIFNMNKERYGYRRITATLKQLGYLINHKTVLKLMNELNLKCKVRIHRYNSYKGNVGKIAPNILNRNFKANCINEKWVTDISEIQFDGKKTYLSVITDLYNREIVSYVISDHPNMRLVKDTLKKAFDKVPDNTHLILHSDQGWQYQQLSYRQALEDKGVIQSMSRKGTCLDNAIAENVFSIIKTELLYLRGFSSMDELKLEIKKYIEYYNNDRIKQKLNWQSPVNYRNNAA